MPDGRKQIVTYKVADAYSGYVADVRYEGEGTYLKYHLFLLYIDQQNARGIVTRLKM